MDRSPLWITHAEIKDFRGIDDLKIEFPRGDVADEGGALVLAGDNGFGKTTVLEALLLGLGQRDLLSPDSATLREQVRYGCRDFHIDLVAECGTEVHTLKSDRRTLEQRVHSPGTWGEGQLLPFWEKAEALEPRAVYFSARRDLDGLGEPAGSIAGARSERESRRVAELKRTLVSMYNRRIDQQAHHQTHVDPRFERLQRFVKRFLGAEATVDVMYLDDDDRNGQDIVVRYGALPREIGTLAEARARAERGEAIPVVLPIDHLSSGQLALFAFAEPLLFRRQAPDLVVIDEPERHFHVQWQRALLPALRELTPASQFVVATHSPEVMDSVLSHELNYLLAPGDPRRLPVEPPLREAAS